MLRAIIASLLLTLLVSVAEAQKRVALVIGNSAYQHTGRLANPKNDATDMAAALKKLGFRVLDAYDLDKASFDRKVRDFATALQGAEAGLFFFAGHSLQVSGHNYLVPIDAELKTASALDFEMVRLEVVQRVMEHETQTNLLFLDACRDNPLARNLARALGTRSIEIGRGFAPVVSGVGTLISFSTQPGNVALDGAGRNSPFAAALTKQLAAPKDDLSAILIDVRNDVIRETQNKQVPWEHSALRGRFYFSPVVPTAAVPPTLPARLSEAAEAWSAVERSNTVPALEAFVRRFGDTFYGDLAKVRLAALQQAEAAKQAAAAKKADDEAWQKQQGAVALSAPKPTAPPRYKLDREQSRVVELSNLFTQDCAGHPDRLDGRVVGRKFDEPGNVVMTGVTLEYDDGRREFVNVEVNLESFDVDMLTRQWVITGLQTLLAEGKAVSLGVVRCGAAGRVVMVDSITPNPGSPVVSSSRKPVPLTLSEERALKPGDSFKECGECPRVGGGAVRQLDDGVK